VELGKRDVLSGDEVAKIRPDIRFRAFDLSEESRADPDLVRSMLTEVLDALAAHELTPLPTTRFAFARAADAFRFMAQARQSGKIVLRMPRVRRSVNGALVDGSGAYLITGGFGAIGIETARWLVSRGARHLVLCGRRAPGPEALEAIRECELAGATIRAVQADAADGVAMLRLIEETDKPAHRLRGIVHAAAIVDDGIIVQQDWARCDAVLRSKARSARILDEATRGQPLDFFVLYSAAGLQLGAPGQCAYAAANAELDALAFARREAGLPALSVAWGAWGTGGMIAELAARGNDTWGARGLGRIQARDAFRRLERLLQDDAAHALALPVDWSRFLETLPAGVAASFFADLTTPVRKSAPPAGQGADAITAKLRALPEAQRASMLVEYLNAQALQAIGRDASMRIDPRTPLREIGLDSLMAVELRNALGRSLGKPLPATLLFDYPTLELLGRYLLDALGLDDRVNMDAPAHVTSGTASAGSDVADLSDAEAEAALIAELDSLSGDRRR
jgi:NAD(P)-dependent dehydrogenase (short-subunit alcohol dehydrogenase family)/acyl carrier protein